MTVPISDEFKDIQFPATAVDVILFAIIDGELSVALIKKNEEPYNGKHALPGRFVRYDEPIEQTAKEALKKKCNIKTNDIYLQQLYTFGTDMTRDTRVRTITITYYAILKEQTNTNKVTWHSVWDLPKLAFDHNKIVDYAVKRLQQKTIKEDSAFAFLPDQFTLTELQTVHETILNTELDKRNFRKKILDEKRVKETGAMQRDGAHRPAKLYEMV